MSRKSLRSFGMNLLLVLLLAGLTPPLVAQEPEPSELPAAVVYKDPNCGCCTRWADHIAAAGFKVALRDVSNVGEIKRELGVPAGMGSCHTAVIGDYVIEGHVPVKVIQRLLSERPDVRGLTVPGMPIGSPGMEGPRPRAYEVYTFGGALGETVYERVPAP